MEEKGEREKVAIHRRYPSRFPLKCHLLQEAFLDHQGWSTCIDVSTALTTLRSNIASFCKDMSNISLFPDRGGVHGTQACQSSSPGTPPEPGTQQVLRKHMKKCTTLKLLSTLYQQLL